VSTLIAVAALAVSLVSFVVNFLASQRAERRGRMPVLVFRDRQESPPRGRVTVGNVGKAPAMNIVYAQGRSDESPEDPIALERGVHESWFNPVHLPPIEPNGELVIHWDTGDGLGLVYTDPLGRYYTVKATAWGMRLFEGVHLPRWPMKGLPYPHDLDEFLAKRGQARAAADGPLWEERPIPAEAPRPPAP
jgi:hypothetical protein